MLEEMMDFPNEDAIAGTTLSQQDIYWTGADKDKSLWITALLLLTSLTPAYFTLYLVGWGNNWTYKKEGK